MGKNNTRACSSFKIQSEESIKATLLRRQRNIRVCLYIATIQGLLNLPYYLLQILSEFLNEFTNVKVHPAYLYADATFYLIFLSQYPLKSLFVYWLHRDWHKNPGSHAYRPIVSKTLSRSEQ
uniref:G-protein coupled receptors family 1 profile domain-containing protein n=1 Tax=Panagrolaimus sp. PS1159 TaxID=55785 RepID=A0AC35F5B8_9BILA